MKRVFVSYAQDDSNAAQELRAILRDAEVSGWMDEADIASGGAISDKVREAIRAASAVIVLISARSVHSQWVQFEVGAALATGKRIIPILIGDSTVGEDLPDWLQQMVYIDARKRSMADVAYEVEHAVSAA